MWRWNEYFEELLETPHQGSSTLIQGDIRKVSSKNLYETVEITIEKVIEAIGKLNKRGKVRGLDNIKPEMLKNLWEEVLLAPHRIFKTAWNQDKIPSNWGIGVILQIHKKGDNRLCSNYRSISLLCTTAKSIWKYPRTKIKKYYINARKITKRFYKRILNLWPCNLHLD